MEFLKKIKNAVIGQAPDYKKFIEEGAIIVDVRSEAEFKSGNANGSINIPMQLLSSKLPELKGKKIILVCRSGMRAQSAKKMLKHHGFIAYNAGAWQNVD